MRNNGTRSHASRPIVVVRLSAPLLLPAPSASMGSMLAVSGRRRSLAKNSSLARPSSRADLAVRPSGAPRHALHDHACDQQSGSAAARTVARYGNGSGSEPWRIRIEDAIVIFELVLADRARWLGSEHPQHADGAVEPRNSV